MKYLLYIILLSGPFFCRIANAQPNFTILLSANGYEKDTVYSDEPLVLRVVLVNRQAQSAANWNQAAQRRLGELEQLKRDGRISDSLYQAEKASLRAQLRVENITTVGSREQPWAGKVTWTILSADRSRSFNWPLKILSNPKTDPVAVLDADAYYMAYCGVDPDMMKQVMAGQYIVEARIGNAVSQSISVVIDRSTQVRENQEHQARLSKYYWHSGDADRSLQYAEMILARNPRQITGLMMKGDALCLKRSLLPALEVYNLALQEYYRIGGAQAEPPEYILDMISAIKNELGGN